MLSESLVEKIAAPISEDQPAGVDTRVDRSFHRIKDARNEASRIEKRAAEDLGDSTKAQKDAVTRSQSNNLWAKVVELGQDALAKRTKDLDIASYMIEATARTDGFEGLAVLFRATRLMVENCWDGMYPHPDEEEGVEVSQEERIEERIRPLSRLSGGDGDGILIEPLSWIEITGDSDPGPYCFWQYSQALEFEKCSDSEKEIRRARRAVTLAQFNTAVSKTSDSFYRELMDAIGRCRTEYDALVAAVNEKIQAAGLDPAPQVSSSRLSEEFSTCQATLRHITGGRFADQAPAANDLPGPADPASSGRQTGTSNGSIDNAIRTREDAFRVLQRVAEFFEQSEPQSLIPSQVRKVIRLAKLSPADFFSEILDNSEIRDQLFKIHGLELKNTES